MITIRQVLTLGRDQLQASPTPATDARLLLEHTLQCDHAYLLAHDDEHLSPEAETTYRQLLARAAQQEPVPYLTGRAPFYDMDFIVTPAVLIPRPETELLVETAIQWAADRGSIQVVDVGTGSGCIAVTLATRLPQAHLTAVDVSAAALAVARENDYRLAQGRVNFALGNLLAPIGREIDLIVANLPYISAVEWPALPDGVKWFEPALALFAGEDGLDLFHLLLPQAAERLNPGGLLLLEIGWQQGEQVEQMARRHFPGAHIEVRQDFGQRDRLVVVQT